MAQLIDAEPLSITVGLDGYRPSLSVVGNAHESNISDVAEALERLGGEQNRCVSLDLGGLESIDTCSLEVLAGSACALRDRRKRLHLKCASPSIRSLFDRMSLADLFCIEHTRNCSPDTCGVVSKPWEIEVFALPRNMANCREARARIDRVAEAVGFSRCQRDDVALAVGEASANAIKHGRSTNGEDCFTVSCVATPEKLCISVSDNGEGFCPDELPTFEEALLADHGRGIHCINAVMDEVQFMFDEGTTVRMVKYGW